MSKELNELRKNIRTLASPEISKTMQWFFKTGKGEYGEGDIFVGLKVPTQRKLARGFKDLALADLKILLNSPVHEERLISLFILVDKYNKGDDKEKGTIFSFYLKYRKGINNWDLVDLSAPKIIGKHLRKKIKVYYLNLHCQKIFGNVELPFYRLMSLYETMIILQLFRLQKYYCRTITI